jgi:hypothetical protein
MILLFPGSHASRIQASRPAWSIGGNCLTRRAASSTAAGIPGRT